MEVKLIDPVCGMVIGEASESSAGKPYCELCWRPFYPDLQSVEYEGVTYYFCSVGCKAAFEFNPRKFHQQEANLMAKDPVCGMEVDPQHAAATSEYKGDTVYFCSKGCQAAFDQNPEKYLAHASSHAGHHEGNH